MNLRPTYLLILLALALAVPATAQSTQSTQSTDDKRFYVDFQLGQSLLGEDVLFADSTNLPFGTAEVDYDTGLTSGFAFGWYATPRWRAEIEYLYRTDELEIATFGDGTTFDGGDFSSVAISANTYLDFPVWRSKTSDRSFLVYVGAGLSWIQEVDIDLERDGQNVEFETDDSGFQWMAGVTWRFSPRWDSGFEIRGFDVSDIEMESDAGFVRSNYAPVNLSLSLSYRF